jgi:hypothetical protein
MINSKDAVGPTASSDTNPLWHVQGQLAHTSTWGQPSGPFFVCNLSAWLTPSGSTSWSQRCWRRLVVR